MPEKDTDTPVETEMTKDQLNLYDRQRFLGLETQKRMLNSLVLITPINGPNAELAKNLVLSGVRVAVYDPHTINELDFETNFLVAHDAIGKNRGETLLNKLREMNEGAKHQLITQDISEKPTEYFSRFTMISTSTKSFKQMKKWDTICREINKPYFNLVGNGLSCFSYVSLGASYSYIVKRDNQIINYSADQKTEVQYLEFDEVTLDSLPFDECFTKDKIGQEIFHSILMMKQAEEAGLSYDPFNPNEEVLEKILAPIKQTRPEKTWEFHTKFARTFGIEFCPVYSVLGSVLSQEFIKIISQKNRPALNWFYYDSETSMGEVMELGVQSKERQTRKERPDLKEVRSK